MSRGNVFTGAAIKPAELEEPTISAILHNMMNLQERGK